MGEKKNELSLHWADLIDMSMDQNHLHCYQLSAITEL